MREPPMHCFLDLSLNQLSTYNLLLIFLIVTPVVLASFIKFNVIDRPLDAQILLCQILLEVCGDLGSWEEN